MIPNGVNGAIRRISETLSQSKTAEPVGAGYTRQIDQMDSGVCADCDCQAAHSVIHSRKQRYSPCVRDRLWHSLTGVASRREIRLELHEHVIECPHCDTALLFISPQETLTLADRTGPNCAKQFLIANGEARRLKKVTTESALGKLYSLRSPSTLDLSLFAGTLPPRSNRRLRAVGECGETLAAVRHFCPLPAPASGC